MNKQEFEQWQKVTQSSKRNWVMDEIRLHNHGEYFFYTGGENGNFVECGADGTVSIGTYEGAFPHIGEALFRVKHTKKVADNANDALSTVLPKMGMQFLFNLIGVVI